MKKLILVRHGKSSWEYPGLKDHDRPLSPRGLRDVPIMAQRFLARKIGLPDSLVTSSAIRALQTAKITALELGFNEGLIHTKDRLYHASSDTLIRSIQNFSDDKESVFLFGHNPGFNDLIYDLGESIDNLPTSGYFGFKANISSWKNFNEKTAVFWFFDYPKNKG